MPALTFRQIQDQERRAAQRVWAVRNGLRPASDRKPAEQALKTARTKLERARAAA